MVEIGLLIAAAIGLLVAVHFWGFKMGLHKASNLFKERFDAEVTVGTAVREMMHQAFLRPNHVIVTDTPQDEHGDYFEICVRRKIEGADA